MKPLKNIIHFFMILLSFFSGHYQGIANGERPSYKAVILNDFLPLYGTNSQGKNEGFVIDLNSYIEKEMGFDIKYEIVNSWSDALKMLENRKVDFIAGIAAQESRDKDFLVSEKIESNPVSFFVRDDDSKVFDEKVLKNKKIATIKGGASQNKLKEAYPESKPYLVDNIETGIVKLLSGEVDAFLIADLVMEKKIKDSHLTDRIKKREKALFEIYRVYLFNKESKDLLEKINRGIISYKQSPLYLKNYEKWYGKEDEYWTALRVFYFMSALLLISSFVFMSIFIIKKIRISAQLREKELQYKSLFQGARDAIVIASIDEGHIEDVNEQALKLFKYKKEELILKPVSIIHPQHKYEYVKDVFEKMDSGLDVGVHGNMVVTKEGEEVPVEISVGEIMSFGKKKFAVGFFRDIRERNKIEEDLKTAKKMAEDASKAKSLFLANMSHEIRTPINGIVGFADLLKETPLNDEQKSFVDAINSSSHNLMIIVNDILDISKIEAGKIEIEKDMIDLEKIVKDVLKSMGYNAHKKNLELICDLDEALPEFILGDGGKIKQVLLNLINNAVKFTDRGHVFVEIKVFQSENQKQGLKDILFSVRDTGIGIEEEKKDSLFKPFVQGDLSYTKKYQGTGLGLAISKRLVELMGGEIKFQSSVGQGTSICFTIPLEIVENSHSKKMDKTFNLKKEQGSVLFIGNNEVVHNVLNKKAEKGKFSLHLASKGREALTILKENEGVQLIFIDSSLADLSGDELVLEIRKQYGEKHKIVILRSLSQEKGLQNFKDLNIHDFLMKPFLINDVLKKIREFSVELHGENKKSEEVKEDLIGRKNQNEKQMGLVKKKILLAEDNDINMTVLLTMIQKTGDFQISQALNGLEAIEKYKLEFPDIVFMDIQMPLVNGIEAFKEIKKIASENGKTVFVYAITAYATSYDKDYFLAQGMDAYLSKPFTLEKIKTLLYRD